MNESLIFAEALKKSSPSERAAYLDAACAHDSALRSQVDELLRLHAENGRFLEPTDGATRALPEPAPITRSYTPSVGEVGAIIAGRYRLTEPVGEGGMGTVWLAHQTEPVKRKVAIKLIKPGMDSKQVLARFDAERQALAMMDHPNIAKVFDGGLHEGRPYFVMELVKGTPITEFCDARKLTPKQRLELFVPVCQAIQHAHQKGIIHRDIKPSNVLIALYDDRAVPKVIDFGVAKATGGTLTEQTIDTAFGGVVGTPQYMSPEQATFNNLDIDTRSDIYALGVLLYELLVGSPPFSKAQLEKKGLLEILRIVREEEPPRPSQKLSTADTLPTISANRNTEPKKLTGLMRNELDWIVLKALEKDRTRRYETANGFAADVQRYLSGEPVLAHPPSAGYRIKKFLRRHRGQVMAASFVLLALLTGIVGTTWQAIRAQRHLEQVQAFQRDLRAALKDMIGTTMSDLVSRKETLSDDDKKFIQNIKGHYTRLADTTGHETEALAIRLEGINGVLRLMTEFEPQQDRLSLSREALALAKELLDRDPSSPPLRRDYSQALESVALDVNRAVSPAPSAEAESLWKEVFERQDALARDYPTDENYATHSATSRINFSSYLMNRGRHVEAEAVVRESIAISERNRTQLPTNVWPVNHLSVASMRLISLLQLQGSRKVEVDQLLEQITVLNRESVRLDRHPVHRQNLAISLLSRGRILLSENRVAEAMPFLAEGAEMFERLVAEYPNRISYAMAWFNAARRIAIEAGKTNETALALAWQRRAYETAEALPAWAFKDPPRDLYLEEHLRGQARALAKLNRQPEADQLLRRAAEIIARSKDPSDSLRLALDLITTGNLKEGIERVERALAGTATPTAEQWLIAAAAFRMAASINAQEIDARKQFAKRAGECLENIPFEDLKAKDSLVTSLMSEYVEVCWMLVLTQQDEPFFRVADRLRSAFRQILDSPTRLPWNVEQIAVSTRNYVIAQLIFKERLDKAYALSDLTVKVMKREYDARKTNFAYSSSLDACLSQQIMILDQMKRTTDAVAAGRELFALSSPERKAYNASFLAALLAKDGQTAEAERVAAETVPGVGGTGANTNYNLCCTYALLGDRETDGTRRERYHGRAIAALKQSIALGWWNHQALETDADLNGLRQRPDFRKLVADLVAKYPAQTKPKPPESAPPAREKK